METTPHLHGGAALLVYAAALALWGIPFVIALKRQHHQRWAILALDLLFGWTGIGWCAALIWSCSAVKPPAPAWEEDLRIR